MATTRSAAAAAPGAEAGAKLRVAAVQLNSTEDVAANLQTADRLVRRAARDGAQLVVLPEKWTVLGRGEVMQECAQTLEGEAVSWARAIAREHQIDLIAGSFVHRRADSTKTANTSLHIGPDGEIRATYDKLHMFDVEVDGTRYAESEHEQPGASVVVTRVGGGASGAGESPQASLGHLLGMSICYDLRFPELYRALSERGAEILAVPSAFTLATTRDHWETLLRARAIENQCFVIAANQIGAHPPGDRSGGRSMIVDPWGIALAVAPDRQVAIIAELDFAMLADVRARLPALSHRRAPGLYAAPSSAGRPWP